MEMNHVVFRMTIQQVFMSMNCLTLKKQKVSIRIYVFFLSPYYNLKFKVLKEHSYDCAHEKRGAAPMAIFWQFKFLVEYDETKLVEVKSDFYFSTSLLQL